MNINKYVERELREKYHVSCNQCFNHVNTSINSLWTISLTLHLLQES